MSYMQNIDQYLANIYLDRNFPKSVGDCFSNKLAEKQPMNEKLTKFNDYLFSKIILTMIKHFHQKLGQKKTTV